jgi:hypothetical protein
MMIVVNAEFAKSKKHQERISRLFGKFFHMFLIVDLDPNRGVQASSLHKGPQASGLPSGLEVRDPLCGQDACATLLIY